MDMKGLFIRNLGVCFFLSSLFALGQEKCQERIEVENYIYVGCLDTYSGYLGAFFVYCCAFCCAFYSKNSFFEIIMAFDYKTFYLSVLTKIQLI